MSLTCLILLFIAYKVSWVPTIAYSLSSIHSTVLNNRIEHLENSLHHIEAKLERVLHEKNLESLVDALHYNLGPVRTTFCLKESDDIIVRVRLAALHNNNSICYIKQGNTSKYDYTFCT